MKRSTFIYSGAVALAAASLHQTFAAAGTPGVIGKIPSADFKELNKEAGAKVKALKPAAGTLSAEDQEHLMEIAMGGTMQLEMSKIAVERASSEDVKAIAKAEVEEQTILSNKLKEIAAAKQISMPSPHEDKKIKKMTDKLQKASGAEFDHVYLEESGVKGHELLKETMTKVMKKANDQDLKMLASTALPLIQTHLQVSKDEMADMKAAA